uniref:Uncharacterized protein n=1 Tax=Romanomermis culicivorax TaxID=13658 RepID=A0A915J2V4_ROMCU
KKIRGHLSQNGLVVDSTLVEESRQIVILVAVSSIVPFMFQFPAIIIRISQYFTSINPWFSRILQSMFPMVPASAPFITAFIIKPYRKKRQQIYNQFKNKTNSAKKDGKFGACLA